MIRLLWAHGGPKDTADTADTKTQTTQDSGKTTTGHSGDSDTESDEKDTGSPKGYGCQSTPFPGVSFIVLGIALIVVRRRLGPYSVVKDSTNDTPDHSAI